MRREYDFIENLDAKDVGYIADKKREHAALLVQRQWRRLKAQREYRRARFAQRADAYEAERTEEDITRIKRNQDYLERVRAYVMAKNPDAFYDKISDARLDEVAEQVTKERQKMTQHEIN